MHIELSKPAIIASIAYLFLAFMILLPFPNTGPLENETNNNRQGSGNGTCTFTYRLLVLIMILIPIGLSIYSINCMMVGHCVVWSYVQAIAIALWVMLFLLVSLLSTERDNTIVVFGE